MYIMFINRRKALLLLAGLWIFGIGAMFIGNNKGEKADIVEAFASGNYMNTVGQVDVYVNYGSKYMSHGARQDMVEGIAKAVGINSEITLDVDREPVDNGCKVTSTYSLTSPVAQTDITIVTIEKENISTVMGVEQYILIRLSIQNSVESAVHYRECIEKYFDELGIDADITLGLKGSIKGPLSNQQKNEICDKILKALDGKLITGSRSEQLYTVYGYSDNISEYVVSGTTKSNINVAITYDNIEDVSWVYVATPVLQQEY